MGRAHAEVAGPRRRALLSAAALAAAPVPGAASAPPDPRRPAGHLGWYPWWLGDGWRRVDARGLARVVWFDAPVADDGGVVPADPYRQLPALRAALPAGCRLEVAATLFGAARFDAVFGRADATRRLHDGLLALLAARGAPAAFDGVQLDVELFEPVPAGARAAFPSFVRRLRDAIDRAAPRATLSAFVTGGGHAPWDRAAAGALDHAAVQLYDAHGPDSPRAGPIVEADAAHPFSVDATLARVDALGLPRARTVLAVPAFGCEWPVAGADWRAATRGRGTATTWGATPVRWMPGDRRVATFAARRHGVERDTDGTPRYRWRAADGWHQGWYEDAASLAGKLASPAARGRGGLALFALGYDGGRLQRALLAAGAGR